jgi:hypothetical protein
MCDSKERLVGYLYDELDAAGRRAFETHLLTCGECRAELGGLRATRGHIATWAPPQPELGLRMVHGAAGPAAAPRVRYAPWGLAAAAALVLAASAAVANVEVRYGADGLVVRTGWGRAEAPVAAVPTRDVAVASSQEVASIDRRLKEIESALSASSAPGMQAVSAPALNEDEVLRRVRQLISESESRQQRESVQRMAQVFQDFDRLRRSDLAVLQQGLGQYQGVTNLEIAQYRDAVNQLLVRTAARQER